MVQKRTKIGMDSRLEKLTNLFFQRIGDLYKGTLWMLQKKKFRCCKKITPPIYQFKKKEIWMLQK
jgi:hypothetical protein